ncbi:hypothetical protein PSPO01_15332 [Paraphaeosphaeria sporulosa]
MDPSTSTNTPRTSEKHATNCRQRAKPRRTNGGRTQPASWLPPPPAPQGTPPHGTNNTVTAYSDRVFTVKIKDHGIAQRYRAQPHAWVKRQVETAIHNNAATRSVKIVAAHQLKSGDIQIFTSNNSREYSAQAE